MGDVRFQRPLDAVMRASDRSAVVRELSDEDLVSALAACARERLPYLANVLATEAHNRYFRLRAIIDAMGEAVFIGRACEPPTFVNRAAERMFGLRADALGTSEGVASVHVSEEARQAYRLLIGRALGERPVATFEFEMRRADGQRFWTSQSVSLIRGLGGDVVGWLAVVRDVTEERALREHLRRSTELLDAILRTSPAACVITDEGLRVRRANAAFQTVAGADAERLRGLLLPDLLPFARRNAEALREAARSMRSFRSLCEPDGENGPWEWAAQPLCGPQGEHFGFLVVGLPASERAGSGPAWLPAVS